MLTGFAPAAYSAQQVGYASPLSYSAAAPLSYSNVYNSPLTYSRFNGAGIAAGPLGSAQLAANPLAYASPLAYNGLGAYQGAYQGAYGGLGVASPLAYSAYNNNPYLRSGLVRPLNYNYLY